MRNPISSSWLNLRNIFRRTGGFARDDKGVTAVEFSLLAMPFFALTCAIMETGVVSLASNIFESALHDSVREIRTGQVQEKIASAGYDVSVFRADMCQRTYGLFDCDGIQINVRTVDSFANASATVPLDPDTLDWVIVENFNPGSGKSIVVAEAYYKWETIFDFMGFNLANVGDRTLLMGSVKVWRNEPFG